MNIDVRYAIRTLVITRYTIAKFKKTKTIAKRKKSYCKFNHGGYGLFYVHQFDSLSSLVQRKMSNVGRSVLLTQLINFVNGFSKTVIK